MTPPGPAVRRPLLLALLVPLLALVLAACGGGSGSAGSSPSGSPAASGAAGGFPRTVTHELGTTDVPRRPERIVAVTDGAELAALLALEGKPVAFGQRNDPLRPWIAAKGGGSIETYPVAEEVSFERLAAYRPDLLLVQNGFATKENLARFQQIAPTVVTSFIDWRTSLRQVAEATGREEQAARLVADTEAATRQAATRLAAVKGRKVQAVTAFPTGEIYVLNDASPLGKLAPQLGLAPFPKAKTAGEAVDQLSLERLTDLDADVLLVQHFDDDRSGYEKLTKQPLWQRLPAVRSGSVVQLTQDESQASYFDSVLTVPLNLAMLERHLT